MDVIQMLKKDHKMVQRLFKEFADLSGNRGAQKKSALVDQICQALTVHAQVEEELVYPAFQEHRALKELVCEAKEEHQVAKQLISSLEQLQPGDEQYDAKVKVLCEYVSHHVKEEEKEIFPQAQKRLSSKRLAALGEEVEERRGQLMGEGDTEETEGDEGMEAELMEGETFDNEEEMDERDEPKNKRQRGRQYAA
jgi:hemerythrin superfamily protein